MSQPTATSRPQPTQKGFTLLEMMIVVAIIAVLATVAVVAFTAYIKNVLVLPFHFFTQRKYAQCERRRPWLLHLALMFGYVIMLVLINSMIATIVIGREGSALTWRQAVLPLTIGLALAILQLSAMALLRLYVTMQFGLPF